MSIIIAKIEGDSCYFISDTKVSIDSADKTVTGESKLRLGPEEGVLKVHILTNRICVAFAGTVDICTSLIHSFVSNSPRTMDSILSHFSAGLKKENDNSAFVLGLMFDNKVPSLFKITKEGFEEGKSFWIGEQTAFSEFQELFLNIEDDSSLIDRTSTAFQKMIEKSSIPTIGDFIISAYFNHKYESFIYEERLAAYSGYEKLHLKKDEVSTFTEGTTEEGAFTVSNLISDRTGKPAICLYFGKGKIGFLYFAISRGNSISRPLVIPNVTRDELNQHVLSNYGINLIGFNMNDGTFKFQ